MPSKSSIHTAKWHRCLDHVSGRKGGGKYNEYAICTSSLGRSGTFKKGFRKKKAAEHAAASLDHEFDTIVREAARGAFSEASGGYPVLEVNNCHGPGRGHPCTGGAGTGVQMELPLGKSAVGKKAAAAPAGASPKKAASPKVEWVAPGAGRGPNHVATYRGMEIHTLPSYTTPYYFVNAPGFGTMEHSASLGRIKNQINRFKDTGMSARGHHKAKASERYQKQKRAAQIRTTVRAAIQAGRGY
jgi:hypothetical protein